MQITKVPVQACHLKTDCHSCISMKDPYCGWCVLEGKWVTLRVDKGFRHLERFHLLVFTLHLAEVEKFVYQNARKCKGNSISSTLTHEFAVLMVLNWEGTENWRVQNGGIHRSLLAAFKYFFTSLLVCSLRFAGSYETGVNGTLYIVYMVYLLVSKLAKRDLFPLFSNSILIKWCKFPRTSSSEHHYVYH